MLYDLPANLRIAKSFRRACETTPMWIQGGELIVGHPCGKPRAGSFSPDISRDWPENEPDAIATDIVDVTEHAMNSYPSLYAYQIHGTLSQSFNTARKHKERPRPPGRGRS